MRTIWDLRIPVFLLLSLFSKEQKYNDIKQTNKKNELIFKSLNLIPEYVYVLKLYANQNAYLLFALINTIYKSITTVSLF